MGSLGHLGGLNRTPGDQQPLGQMEVEPISARTPNVYIYVYITTTLASAEAGIGSRHDHKKGMRVQRLWNTRIPVCDGVHFS